MGSRNDLLFAGRTLDDALRAAERSVPGKVDDIPNDQFLATPEEGLISHIVGSLQVEPLQLHENARYMESEETKVDVSRDFDRAIFQDHAGPFYVPGLCVTVFVPYTGDDELWSLRPNPFSLNPPHARIEKPRGGQPGNVLVTVTQASDRDESRIKKEFQKHIDEAIRGIRSNLDTQRQQIEAYNARLEGIVRKCIGNRRARLEKHDGIASFLDIPLKLREGAPDVKPVKVERKFVRPLPPPPRSGYKAEPGIVAKTYEHIIDVLRHECRAFENAPGTFARFTEEELRDVILAHLNGHYQGGATGEAFNRSGKTDIRIVEEDRAAFIAECKIWSGPRSLTGALAQLLGYLTWRDCKAALLIFNKRNANFTAILERIPDTLKGHSHFKRPVDETKPGEWRYVFRSQEDELREITIHVLAVNIYTPE